MPSLILFGGSFDPIHNGHINIAENALKIVNADKVVFIPAKNPLWKDPIASNYRLDMLELAIKGHENFAISHFELESQAPVNYSIETVKHFVRHYEGYKLYFLIGFDQVNNLDRWHEIDELSKLVQIIAVARPGYPSRHENIKKYNVKILECQEYNVSSTQVRSLHSLDIPRSVLKYIIDKDIYFTKIVRAYMSDKRYEHVISTAWLSYDIAIKNKLDPSIAFIAAYLHDVAKEMDKDAEKGMIQIHYREYIDYPEVFYHQFLGEFLVKNYFKINDKRILEAIKYHTTGNKSMGKYAKILYAADKIEPTRGFDSKELIQGMYKNVNKGFVQVLKANKEYYEEKGYSVDTPLQQTCFDYYLKEK